MITLDVEYYSSLESLADDIKQALGKSHDITSKDMPLKVELSSEHYDMVISDLTAFGSFEGVRTKEDLKYNTWQVADEYISFIKKKEDGPVSDRT